MPAELDLATRFADIRIPNEVSSLKRFGRLAPLADWLTSTSPNQIPEPITERELIVFSRNEKWASDASSVATGGSSINRRLVRVADSPETEPAIELGISAADQAIDSGIQLLFIAADRAETLNDIPITVGALTGRDAASVTPRRNARDELWMQNAAQIRDGIYAAREHLTDPVTLLSQTGASELAALLGCILQAANRATPVVLIDDAALTAALVARRIAYRSRDWVLPAVDLVSPAGQLAQRYLDRPPILELAVDFNADYLTPMIMTIPIIDAVLALLRNDSF